jgi:hypothetical protein
MTTISVNGLVALGFSATLGCSTNMKQPYKWHWMRNGELIGGANSAASYTTHPLRESDLTAKYSITVYGRDGTIESSPEITLRPPAEEKKK